VRALRIYINGEQFLVAGNTTIGISAYVGCAANSETHHLMIVGPSDDADTPIWPSAELQLGDEVRIEIIETDEVDRPYTHDELMEEKRAEEEGERWREGSTHDD
jgi:hypothetical protein